MYRRTNSNDEVSLSSELDHSLSEELNSSGHSFSFIVEVRLWLLMQSKLVNPLACRGLKSLSTSSVTGIDSHEMLDDSLDVAGDIMLDEDDAPILDEYGDAMELDAPYHVEFPREHSLERFSGEGNDPLNDDVSW